MKTISVKCSNCGNEFQKLIYYITQAEKRGQTNYFCSNKCSCQFNSKRNSDVIPKIREREYLKNPKHCPQCDSIIPYNNKNNTYCSSQCSAIYTQKNGGHCQWSEEDKKKLSDWNKKNNPKSTRLCLYCQIKFNAMPSSKRKCCSRKCAFEYIKKSGEWKGINRGGYREKGGRGKQGWYKGYYCNSSWELAWLIYQLEHNVIVKRNDKGFEYEFEGKNKKYYPDFILPDGTYVEIKGYHSKQVDAKIKSFPFKLTILHKKELTDVFEYVQKKHGKDYIHLYEKT